MRARKAAPAPQHSYQHCYGHRSEAMGHQSQRQPNGDHVSRDLGATKPEPASGSVTPTPSGRRGAEPNGLMAANVLASIRAFGSTMVTLLVAGRPAEYI